MGLASAYRLLVSARVLSAGVVAQLEDSIVRAADWLVDNVCADQWVTNYIFSSGMALQQAFEVTGDPCHSGAAERWIREGVSRINEEGLICGEWVDDQKAERGAVDPGYNLEMALPSLAIYALQTGNSEFLDDGLKVLTGHLPCLSPDGALDVGWGSRGYKWAYLGSRTAHGVCMGLLPLVGRVPSLKVFVRNHLALMRAMTKDGVLGNGVGFWEQEAYRPCLIPSITKAAGLAFGLLYMDNPAPAVSSSPSLPSSGVWLFNAADAAVVRTRGMSMSISCTHYREGLPLGRAVPPTGGTTALLYHPEAGAIQVASQGLYGRVEHQNMPEVPEAYVASPRVERRSLKAVCSNIFDYGATMRLLTAKDELPCVIEVTGRLRHTEGQGSGPGYHIRYTIAEHSVEKRYVVTPLTDTDQYVLIEPLVIHPQDEVEQTDTSVTISSRNRRVVLTVDEDCRGRLLPTNSVSPRREWVPFPGVWVLPIEVALSAGADGMPAGTVLISVEHA